MGRLLITRDFRGRPVALYRTRAGQLVELPVPHGLGASSLVSSLAAAIARQENANPAWNNPGALTWGAGMTGTTANGIATFPDLATGEAALEHQIQVNIDRGLTLDEFFAGKPGVYAGYASAAAGNDPARYSANLAQWTGLDPNVPLNQLGGAVAADSGGGTASDNPSDTAAVIDSGTAVAVVLSLAGLAALYWVAEG